MVRNGLKYTQPEPYPAPSMSQEIPILSYPISGGVGVGVSEGGRLALGLSGPDPETQLLVQEQDSRKPVVEKA